mgnify:CR=1 FL=1
MENTAGRALGAPKLRKMVPRGLCTAQGGCPEAASGAQRRKNCAQETPKNVPGTPISPHLGLSAAQMGGFLVKNKVKWVSKQRNIEKLKNLEKNNEKPVHFQSFSLILQDLELKNQMKIAKNMKNWVCY